MRRCYRARCSFRQEVAVDCCVSTEMLLAVEQAEMEIRDGGNYWYRLGRNVAFERQFLMCKLVPSCTLSENTSLSRKRGRAQQRADGHIKEVTTVWAPVTKEQHGTQTEQCMEMRSGPE